MGRRGGLEESLANAFIVIPMSFCSEKHHMDLRFD